MKPGKIKVAKPSYGYDLISNLPKDLLDDPIILTQEEAWQGVKDYFQSSNLQIHFVTTMDYQQVENISQSFRKGTAVFGIGGGMALDHAKFSSAYLSLPLVLIPTILSVDAAYTKETAVRKDNRVQYVGEVYPEHLLIDYGILQKAPKILNRAGTGDIMSIFTALWDWREAHNRLGEKYDAEVAEQSTMIIKKMVDHVHDLREMNEIGIFTLSQAYVDEVSLCAKVGNARPEEGSEHYIAYCLESLTKRSYIHGQLIGCCILIAGAYQGQDIKRMADFFSNLQLDVSLKAIGTTKEEMKQALINMGSYIEKEKQLLPGIFHFNKGISQNQAEELLQFLSPYIGT